MNNIFVSAENRMYKRKLTESQDMRVKTLDSIFETLVSLDENEGIEAQKISEISKKISEAMGFDESKVREIEFVAKRHDIGNIAIKREVFAKKNKLSDIEFDEIKKHTENGYQIFKSVDLYSFLAESILSHHERWDGSGYPRGLKKENIPIASRIIAVSDAYVAMTSERPYRKALSKEEAIKEIKKNSGKQFDPLIVDIFLKEVAINIEKN
jgi:HD-GYP domain-containing protein (c-di-GMP phosphodiesterase class II)